MAVAWLQYPHQGEREVIIVEAFEIYLLVAPMLEHLIQTLK
jgi:hypothetical protein